MPLESATYLNSLVPTNPVGATDQKAQGDDHIRLIKSVLLNTFPGMVGRAWRTQGKGGNYTLVATDNMSIIEATASFTLGADAASILGNGFIVMVATVAHTVVFDPNAGEVVNGQASITIPAGYVAFLFCNGSAWNALMTHRDGSVPAGTRMLFQQTSAPIGWSKDPNSAYNDAAIRFTTGTVATGGSTPFATHFGSSNITDGHALTQAQTPVRNHVHGHNISVNVDGNHDHFQREELDDGQGASAAYRALVSGTDLNQSVVNTPIRTSTDGAHSHGVSGGIADHGDPAATTHAHTISPFNIKFADVIVATKA